MLYEEILRGCQEYHSTPRNKNYDSRYILYFGFFKDQAKWNCPNMIDKTEVDNLMRQFLNRLGCHMNYGLWRETLSSLQDVVPILKPLDGMTILTINDSADFDRVEKAYNRLTSVNGIGDTIASKILHTINPTLFVMRDETIFYDCNWNSYAAEFLPEMQQLTEKAVRQMEKQKNLSREKAIKYLMEHCKHNSLAKIIDEYNFVISR